MSWLPLPPTPPPQRLHNLPPPCFMMLSLLYISQTCFVGLNRLVCIGRLFMCVLSSSLEYFTTLGARNWQFRLISSSSSIQLSDPSLFTLPNTNSTTMPTVNICQPRKAREINETIFMTLLRFKASWGSDFSIRRGAQWINQIPGDICSATLAEDLTLAEDGIEAQA